MPRVGRFAYSSIFFLLVMSFSLFELWSFSTGHLSWVIALLGGMAVALLWAIFHSEKVISYIAFPIYLLLSCSIVVFLINYKIEYYSFLALFLFFPILVLHYFSRVQLRYIPGTAWIILMLLGFLSSIVYQTIMHRGWYEYSLETDGYLLAAIGIFYLIYMLLSIRTLSPRYLIIALTISVFPLIIYDIVKALESGGIKGLILSRFGSGGAISSNQVSSILDFALPFAVFLAINEKKILFKFVFWALSFLYCLCMFLTSSRGSMPGLIALPVFFVLKSRSAPVWIAILMISAAMLGLFGGRVTSRILMPSHADMYSNLGRVELAKSAQSILKQNNYFWGIGMNNFTQEKFKYGFSAGFDPGRGMSSHDIFLEMWLGWGLPGLLRMDRTFSRIYYSPLAHKIAP